MKRRGLLPLALSLLVVLGAWLFAGRPPVWQEHGPTVAGLTDLQGVEPLRTRFNADAGLARLVLILSPT